MKGKCATAALLLAIASISISAPRAKAQEAEEKPSLQFRADPTGGLYKRGSQTLMLSVGAQIPLFILPADPDATQSRTLLAGATFGLAYQYFIADRIAIGASFAGSFNTTVGGRSLFIAPLSFRTAWWTGSLPWEYFLALEAGGTIMRLSGSGMITPFAKAGGGVLHQVNSSWSIGAQAYWWLVPEVHTGIFSGLTRYGNLLEISASAVYHL